MCLQHGVNFINILRSTPFFECFEAFLYLWFGFVVFWRKNIGEKAARKMLMKLTNGSQLLRRMLKFLSVICLSFFYFLFSKLLTILWLAIIIMSLERSRMEEN